jgi:hypothetical protein
VKRNYGFPSELTHKKRITVQYTYIYKYDYDDLLEVLPNLTKYTYPIMKVNTKLCTEIL